MQMTRNSISENMQRDTLDVVSDLYSDGNNIRISKICHMQQATGDQMYVHEVII